MIDENKFVCKEDFLSSGAIKEANLNSGKKKKKTRKKKNICALETSSISQKLSGSALFLFVCLFVCLARRKKKGEKNLFILDSGFVAAYPRHLMISKNVRAPFLT